MSRYQMLLSWLPAKVISTSIVTTPGKLLISPTLKNPSLLLKLCYSQSAPIGSHMFLQTENNHARSFLLNNPSYEKLMFKPDINLIQGNVHKVVQKFVDISNEPDLKHLNEDCYSSIISELVQHTNEFNDNDLLSLIYTISKFPFCVNPAEYNYAKLWKSIDEECLKRLKSLKWTMDEAFRVDDALYPLYLAKFQEFRWYIVKKSFRKCDKLTKEQFTRFLFSLTQRRNLPKAINTYELEFNLEKHIDKLNVQELAIICMAFFKTQTPIRSPTLMIKVLDKAIQNAKDIDSISLAAIAKVVRLVTIYGAEDNIISFQETFISQLDRLSLQASLHLALAGTQVCVIHRELLAKVLEKLENGLSEIRLKEIERILLASTMFNMHRPSLTEKVVAELQSPQRAKEIDSYGRSLTSIVYSLSVFNTFPFDLIDRVLSKEFIKTFYKKSMPSLQRDMLVLDITLDIHENPKSMYTGNRLTEKSRNLILKWETFFMGDGNDGRISHFQNNLMKISEIIQDVYKSKPMLLNLLPQFHTAEILYCSDKEGNAVEIPDYMKKYEAHEVKWIPEQEKNGPILYHAFVVCNRNNLIYGTKEPNGNSMLRERQLRKLGYIVHRVYVDDWETIKKDARCVMIKDFIAAGCKNYIIKSEERPEKAVSFS